MWVHVARTVRIELHVDCALQSKPPRGRKCTAPNANGPTASSPTNGGKSVVFSSFCTSVTWQLGTPFRRAELRARCAFCQEQAWCPKILLFCHLFGPGCYTPPTIPATTWHQWPVLPWPTNTKFNTTQSQKLWYGKFSIFYSFFTGLRFCLSFIQALVPFGHATIYPFLVVVVYFFVPPQCPVRFTVRVFSPFVRRPSTRGTRKARQWDAREEAPCTVKRFSRENQMARRAVWWRNVELSRSVNMQRHPLRPPVKNGQNVVRAYFKI